MSMADVQVLVIPSWRWGLLQCWYCLCEEWSKSGQQTLPHFCYSCLLPHRYIATL